MATVVGYSEAAKFRTTCEGCGAIVEYVRNEARVKNYSCCGSSETGSFITCPGCGRDIEVHFRRADAR
jgi:transcription initiation factor IIE alpha subunit